MLDIRFFRVVLAMYCTVKQKHITCNQIYLVVLETIIQTKSVRLVQTEAAFQIHKHPISLCKNVKKKIKLKTTHNDWPFGSEKYFR